jgi:hypothetical protein
MILNNRINEKLSPKQTIKYLAQMIFVLVMILPSAVAFGIDGQSEKSSAEAKLTLTADSHIPISISKKKIEIIPGESLTDAAKRIAEEEAQKKIRVEAIAREKRVYGGTVANDVYIAAAARYGIADWRYLKAIHYVETGCSSDPNKHSYAGASGPMQFLPSTWKFAGVDGDGDGRADIGNVVDAINGAAHYLAMSGGQNDIRKGLYSYNHSTSYVNKVTGVAMSISQ